MDGKCNFTPLLGFYITFVLLKNKHFQTEGCDGSHYSPGNQPKPPLAAEKLALGAARGNLLWSLHINTGKCKQSLHGKWRWVLEHRKMLRTCPQLIILQLRTSHEGILIKSFKNHLLLGWFVYLYTQRGPNSQLDIDEVVLHISFPPNLNLDTYRIRN